MQQLNRVGGYDKVNKSMVHKWKRPGAHRKRGHKVNEEFEAQILGMLVYTTMEKVNDVERAVIVANVAHAHAVIQAAGRKAQALPASAEDAVVQKINFSRPWVRGFLKRAALRRRRITTIDKVRPSVVDVRAVMADIQKTREEGDFHDDEVVNPDETGVFFGAPPKHQFIPKSASHAAAPPSDDKSPLHFLALGQHKRGDAALSQHNQDVGEGDGLELFQGLG